jgi:hypothetical protein
VGVQIKEQHRHAEHERQVAGTAPTRRTLALVAGVAVLFIVEILGFNLAHHRPEGLRWNACQRLDEQWVIP